MAATQPTWALGNICRDVVSHHFLRGVIDCLRGGTDWFIQVAYGPYLDDGRNMVVAEYVTNCPAEWLVFVDSDVEFTRAKVDALVASAAAIGPCVMGGVYPNLYTNRGVCPVVYCVDEESKFGRVEYRPVQPDELDTADGLPEHPSVTGAFPICGTGMMAIHRDVFTALQTRFDFPCAWFAEEIREGVHLGEDMTFCLRVAEVGYCVYVDRSVTVRHAKSVMLDYSS